MFRLSTRSKYETRLMLELAINYNKGFVLLKDIAERENLSEGYLEQCFALSGCSFRWYKHKKEKATSNSKK
ncbi:hypothetical protein DRQ09_06215 [candidate division KSB1 bacterium]|nr:MAG: hypothetical protein DRQ09_06215 [candidate division KSB1 bacterium]